MRLEIVHKLVAAMKLKLSDEEESALRATPTANVVAYDYYLRGRSLMRQPDRYPLSTAIQTLELAVRTDSNFAAAQSALGWVHVLAYEAAEEPVPSHIVQATTCVQRAVSLGSRSSETFRVWGMIEQFHSDYAKAVERFEQAVSISPSDAESQRRLAIASAAKDRIDGALKAAQRAATDDPSNIASYTILGLVQQYKADKEKLGSIAYKDALRAALRSYEQGLRLARDRSEYGSGLYADVLVYLQQADRAVEILNDRLARARQSHVEYYKLGRIEQSAGKPKQEWQSVFLRAKDLLATRLAAQPDDAVALSYLALVHTRLGEFKEAIAASSRAQQLAPDHIEVLYNIARMYALQREKNQALEYLGKAVNRRYSLASILDMDFFNLHSEPEFVSTVIR